MEEKRRRDGALYFGRPKSFSAVRDDETALKGQKRIAQGKRSGGARRSGGAAPWVMPSIPCGAL